ncbi:hypothetical protein Hypma_001004 [Hypsizygus marmoreus]|uniref:Uncharacterized protein n=1 Tax=Hypsizygus marmoreus TaxID=39966 RepID=A0A369JCW6_HYPMA|nr:hypothetical protein Hypma_001004 [Hypsizygus marmoreus]
MDRGLPLVAQMEEWHIYLIGQLILDPRGKSIVMRTTNSLIGVWSLRSKHLSLYMGHLKPLSPDPNCERLAFEQLREDAFQAIDDLIRPLKELCLSGRKVGGLNATLKQLQQSEGDRDGLVEDPYFHCSSKSSRTRKVQ